MLFILGLILTLLTGLSAQCINNLELIDGVCSCKPDLFLYNQNCIESCPTRFHPDFDKNQCVPCSPGCQSCTDNTPSGCTACFTSFLPYYGAQTTTCTCQYPDIREETIDTECAEDESEIRWNSTHKRCFGCADRCPEGKYFDGEAARCLACPENCQSCVKSSVLQCLFCKESYFWDIRTFSCQETCTGYQPSSSVCMPSSCSADAFYDEITGECIASCDKGTTLDLNYYGTQLCGLCVNTVCADPNAYCTRSNDPNACTGCLSGIAVVRSATLLIQLEMPKTTYDCLTTEEFQSKTNLFSFNQRRAGTYYYCSPECETCSPSNFYECGSCKPGYTLHPDNTCRPNCVPPYSQFGDFCSFNVSLVETPLPPLTEASKAAAKVTNVASIFVPVFALASQIFNPAASYAATRTQSLNMLLYLRYLNIDYPKELSNKFNESESSTYQIDFEFPKRLFTKGDEYEAPARYNRYGLSPLFLVNFWGNIITVAIIIAITLFCTLMVIKKVNPKNGCLRRILGWFTDIFVYNYIISFCFSSLSDAFFFIIVQIQSYPGPEGIVSTTSMVISCILCVAIIVIAPIFLLRKYNEIFKALKHNPVEKVAEKMPGAKVLFEDFKHNSRWQLYFMMVYGVRVILFAIFVTVIPQSPIAQICIMALLNGALTFYMIKYRPFVHIISNFEILFYEASLFIANVMTGVIANCDWVELCSDEMINNLTRGILAINFILSIGSMCFSFYSILLDICTTIKYFTHKRRLRITPGDSMKITFNTIGSDGALLSNRDEKAKLTEVGTITNIGETRVMEHNLEGEATVKGEDYGSEKLETHPEESPLNKMEKGEETTDENKNKIGA